MTSSSRRQRGPLLVGALGLLLLGALYRWRDEEPRPAHVEAAANLSAVSSAPVPGRNVAPAIATHEQRAAEKPRTAPAESAP